MVLQNIIWKEATEETKELYYRGKALVQSSGDLILVAGANFTTDTYMNLFDIKTWRKYTTVENIVLRLEVQGYGKIILKPYGEAINQVVTNFQCERKQEISLSVPKEWNEKVCFEIVTDTEVILYKASYISKEIENKNVKLAIIICTYKRERSLKRLLEELGNVKINLQENLEVYVVDNASEVVLEKETWIHLYQNPNTGGSGGFGRGMDEIVKHYNEFAATHVLLMDDDVKIQPESVYRLYTLLSYVRIEYQDEIVAGRMFRMDKQWMQYTAAEIWNGGDLLHIGFEVDMREQENLSDINNNSGAEYSGWWFCCIPYEFVKDNRPLPFFLHCDDVEYGLRHGGTPIILNGIQVWHETYEYRQSPVVAYYDMRNSLIVNAMYGKESAANEMVRWKKAISQKHVKEEFLCETNLIRAMMDFLRGPKWFFNIDLQRYQKKIEKNKRYVKLINKYYWRIVYIKFRLKEKKIYEIFRKCSHCNMQ